MQKKKKLWLGVAGSLVVLAVAGVLFGNADLFQGRFEYDGKGGGGKGGRIGSPLTPPTSNAVSVTPNPGFVPTALADGATNIKVGSFVLTALSSETRVTELYLTSNATFNNVKLMAVYGDSESQLGYTMPQLRGGIDMVHFYDFALTLNRLSGLSKIINIYADVPTYTCGFGGGVPAMRFTLPSGSVRGLLIYDPRTRRNFYSPRTEVALQPLTCS